MPKIKTHRGAKKRFKITKTGKILHACQNRRHILTSKSSKRKRRLRKMRVLSHSDTRRLLQALNFN